MSASDWIQSSVSMGISPMQLHYLFYHSQGLSQERSGFTSTQRYCKGDGIISESTGTGP